MSDIPEDVMKRASALLLDGLYDCVSIDSSPYHECLEWQNETAIAILAAALMEERSAERERAKAHWLQWHQKRMEISRGFWLRAGKKALGGDLRELRNRVDLAEAEPVQLVLSEASHEA